MLSSGFTGCCNRIEISLIIRCLFVRTNKLNDYRISYLIDLIFACFAHSPRSLRLISDSSPQREQSFCKER